MARRPPARRFFQLFVQYWLPVLAYVTLILALSSQPRLHPPVTFRESDKLWHAVEYLVLGVLLVRALRASLRVSRPLFAATMALGLGVLIASGDEFLQSFIPGRFSSAWDVLADAAGLLLAQVLYVWFVREPRR